MGKIAKNRAGTNAAHGVIPTITEEILKAEDVAALLGITVPILRRYDMPRHVVGRNVLYFRSDVHQWVRQCQQRGNDNAQFDW